MSIKVAALVWEHADLNATRLLILLAMADFADDDGSNIFPSHETLCNKARCDQRTLTRSLEHFEKVKLVECVERESGRRGRFRRYAIRLDNLVAQSRQGPPVQGDQTGNKAGGQNVHRSKTGGHLIPNRPAFHPEPVDISSRHIETRPRPTLKPSYAGAALSPKELSAREVWGKVLTSRALPAGSVGRLIGGKAAFDGKGILTITFPNERTHAEAMKSLRDVERTLERPVVFCVIVKPKG